MAILGMGGVGEAVETPSGESSDQSERETENTTFSVKAQVANNDVTEQNITTEHKQRTQHRKRSPRQQA